MNKPTATTTGTFKKRNSNSSSSSRRMMKKGERIFLGEGYEPGNYDVICGRGTKGFIHTGNRRFRVTIAMNLDNYMNLSTRVERTVRVKEILKSIRQAGGHFLKQDAKSGFWYDIGDKAAREKVGHALRDAQAERNNVSLSQRKRIESRTGDNSSDKYSQISSAGVSTGFLDLVNDLLVSSNPDEPTTEATQEKSEKSGNDDAPSVPESDTSAPQDVLMAANSTAPPPPHSTTTNPNEQHPYDSAEEERAMEDHPNEDFLDEMCIDGMDVSETHHHQCDSPIISWDDGLSQDDLVPLGLAAEDDDDDEHSLGERSAQEVLHVLRVVGEASLSGDDIWSLGSFD